MLNKPVLSLPLKCNHAQNCLFRYSVPTASNIKKTVDLYAFLLTIEKQALVHGWANDRSSCNWRRTFWFSLLNNCCSLFIINNRSDFNMWILQLIINGSATPQLLVFFEQCSKFKVRDKSVNCPLHWEDASLNYAFTVTPEESAYISKQTLYHF